MSPPKLQSRLRAAGEGEALTLPVRQRRHPPVIMKASEISRGKDS